MISEIPLKKTDVCTSCTVHLHVILLCFTAYIP